MSTKTVVSNTIGQDLKEITHLLVKLPVRATAVSLRLGAKTLSLTMDVVEATPEVGGELIEIHKRAVYGAFHSDLTEVQANKGYEALSFASIRKDAVAGSVGAGQSTTKAVSGFFAG